MNTLDRLKELEAKATPEPWVSRVGGSGICNKYIDEVVIDGDERDTMKPENVQLIVQMRNSLRKLLAVVAAARNARYFTDTRSGIDELDEALKALDES